MPVLTLLADANGPEAYDGPNVLWKSNGYAFRK